MYKAIKKYFKFMYDKWVKAECRHMCIFCKFRKECIDEFLK